MNVRERNLLLAVGGLGALLALGLALRAVILLPVRRIDKQIAGLQAELKTITKERQTYFTEEDRVKGFTRRTFSDDVDKASAKSGQMLTQLILQSGLVESEFSRLPLGPRKLRQAQEIGWSVQGDGALMQIVNLLFLLERSPYLHRLEGVTLTPAEGPGRVRVRFRFLTLVLTPAPTIEWREPTPQFTLDNPERRLLDPLVVRDVLRPYIKRPPAPPSPGPAGGAAAPVAATPVPGPESLRIVSLSEWEGVPEIHVRDLVHQRTLRYRPGDTLAGGVVVMVDYRGLPIPGNEVLKSFSRVILKIDNEYWAIERGRTLADKYKMTPDQLPEKLPGT